MSKKTKKNGHQDDTLKKLILATAVTNLITALVTLISKLLE